VSSKTYFGLNKTVVAGIQITVFQEMLADMRGTKKSYGAFFIEAYPKTINFLPVLADDTMPRLEFGTNNLVFADFLDRVTGKPSKLFSVEIMSISNNVAVANGVCASGSLDAVGITYSLKWTGTNWVIFSRSTPSFSQLKKQTTTGYRLATTTIRP
jgi:hypothetical protein